MRVIVRSKEVRFRLPIPLALADAAVFLLPEAVVAEIREAFPASCRPYITKRLLRELVRECRAVLKQYKGLEILQVEAQDGTFVSIRL